MGTQIKDRTEENSSPTGDTWIASQNDGEVGKKTPLSSLPVSAATQAALDAQTHTLSEITDAGTAAALDSGTGAGNVVKLDGSAKLPAVDGSQLTNLPGGGGGDMTKAVYDPTSVEGDAFARANHTGTQPLASISDAGTAAASDTGDFAPALGVDDNYVTDAEKIVLGNTSGTNTGDEIVATTSASGIVELATDGENATGKVVQGNDGRINTWDVPAFVIHNSAGVAAENVSRVQRIPPWVTSVDEWLVICRDADGDVLTTNQTISIDIRSKAMPADAAAWVDTVSGDKLTGTHPVFAAAAPSIRDTSPGLGAVTGGNVIQCAVASVTGTDIKTVEILIQGS